MGHLVADDGADGAEVHVPRQLGVEEDALQDAGRELDVVPVQAVEGVNDAH